MTTPRTIKASEVRKGMRVRVEESLGGRTTQEHGDLCLDCFHPTCLTVGELIPVADLILGSAR